MSLRTLSVVLLLAGCTPSPRVAVDPSPAQLDPVRLTEVLRAQFDDATAAWNRGDLDAFMATYARDSATSFVDGFRPQRGFAWIRAHYAPAFEPGATRDSLAIQELAARPLSPVLALVTARYLLTRAGKVVASGPFTVVMEERTDGWKIVHDHSSSDPR
jgi:uncharacterized protein (TIGR02246 family)